MVLWTSHRAMKLPQIVSINIELINLNILSNYHEFTIFRQPFFLFQPLCMDEETCGRSVEAMLVKRKKRIQKINRIEYESDQNFTGDCAHESFHPVFVHVGIDSNGLF